MLLGGYFMLLLFLELLDGGDLIIYSFILIYVILGYFCYSWSLDWSKIDFVLVIDSILSFFEFSYAIFYRN